MLLDTASLYFRAYFGLPSSLRSPDGQPVNAVRGLLDFIAALVRDHRPTHLACCWDNDWRPQWRVDLLPSYKTHRVAAPTPAQAEVVGAGGAGAESGVAEQSDDELAVQVPRILAVLEALGIAVVGADGYEADDVIGTLATGAAMPVDVVTGDRDLFQLVDDEREVSVLWPAKGMRNIERVRNDWIRDKYGIDASQYADFAVLRGDKSDGIPGVNGIGEKIAASLLREHHDLEGILKVAGDPDGPLTAATRRKFAEAVDYLAVGQEVVRVATDLDLGVGPDDLALPGPPGAEFDRLADELGLGGSATRIREALAAT